MSIKTNKYTKRLIINSLSKTAYSKNVQATIARTTARQQINNLKKNTHLKIRI